MKLLKRCAFFRQTMNAEGGPPPRRARIERNVAPIVTPINEVSVNQDSITITARLVNKSTLAPQNWNRHSFVELLDRTGEIRCGFNSRFRSQIEGISINGTYTFTNLEVRKILRRDRERFGIPIDHDCELILKDNSQIREAAPEADFPHREYNFTRISRLNEMVEEGRDEFVDFIGVCVALRDPIQSKGTLIRDLVMVDDSSGPEPHHGFKLSLWGQPADQRTRDAAPPVPFVVVLKRAKLSHFDGGRLNCGIPKMPLFPSLCQLPNPNTAEEEARLLNWYRQATA